MNSETTAYRTNPQAGHDSARWTQKYRGELSRKIDEQPAPAVLAAFGAGFCVGLGIAAVLAASKPPAPRSRAEELGNRLVESLHDFLPEALARKMG